MTGSIRNAVKAIVFPVFLILLPITLTSTSVALDEEGSPATPCHVLQTEPAQTLSGSVSDSTGARVSHGRIVATCDDFRREVETAPDGTYSLSLPPGQYTLTAVAPRFALTAREVAVAAGNENVANFTLKVASTQSSVTVTGEVGYAVAETIAGTKTDTPLMEVPQAITVVNRRLLDDQGAVKLDDALKNVAGVMPGGYYYGWDYYRIRGFDASFNTYIDGLRGGNGVGEETFGLESVQVLKGPSSALYGQSVLGGIVDIHTKEPVPDRFATLEFTGGSFGHLEPAVDLGGSLNGSRSLYGRLVALYRSRDSFVDYVYNNRVYVAPSATWKIDSATSLTFLSRFQKDTGRAGFPLPAAGTVLPNINGNIDIHTYVGELNGANHLEEDNQQFGYKFTHQFNDAISVQQNARFSWYGQHWNNILYPAFLDEDERTLYRYPLNWRGSWQDYAIDTAMKFEFKTGAVRHEILTGVDYFRNPSRSIGESIDFSDQSQYVPLDLFHPVYNQPLPTLSPYTSGNTLAQYTGVYLQDQIRLLPRLSLTLSGRFDQASNHEEGTPQDHHDTAFTPRVGVSYQARQDVAVYASFSKSFMPQTGRVYDGSTSGAFVSPERGKQWEAGVKTDLFNRRLNTTFALYQLDRRNVVTDDPAHPNFYLVTGQQRSRGVELENTIHVIRGLNLTAGYAYIDAKVTEDNAIPVGTPTQNVPKHAFNTWATYEFEKGFAKGIGFGFGGRYYTNQSGDLMDTFKLPAYGLMDASVFYRRMPFALRVNFYNLSDRRYFLGSYDSLYVNPGEPFAVRTTVSWTF